MTNIWHDISPSRINPEDFIAVIEIEKGSKKKYELDKETGHIILDRILYTSTHYPANYGLIPRTFADDGDPLDVLVLCSEVLAPLSLVRCYPIGVITMQDQGKMDEKIIAIPFEDPTYNTYRSARCAISSVCIRIWKARPRWWTRNRVRMRRNASFRTVWTIISKNSAAEPDKMHAPALPAPWAFLCFLGFICALQRAGLTDQRHTLILL